MWWVFAEMVLVELGSKTTMSASLPTAISALGFFNAEE